MNLKDIINPLLKWWWLLVAATLVAAVSSYYATRPLPPVYQATSTLIVGSAFYDTNPTGTEYGLSIKLAEAYALMAQRGPVKNATMEALGLTWLPAYVARQIPENQLIEIVVTDDNPQRAQAVANELARQLILQSPTATERQEQARLAFVNTQLDSLQTEIEHGRATIDAKKQELEAAISAVQIADLQRDIAALEQKQTLMQTNYADLLSTTQGGAINSLRIIETASLPTRPIGPNKPMIIVLVSAIGFALAAAAAHLLEFMDKTLKTPEDIQRVLGLPVIGFIGEIDGDKGEFTYTADNPRSPIAEAFRMLRTNIEFASVDKPVKTLLLTSADSSDGKTTVATNLAVIMSQGEKKVVLMDADLRKPSVHKALGIPAQPGLSDVFRDRLSVIDAIRPWKDRNVTVITAGATPPNPAELLGSKKMGAILQNLREVVDIVVIDGPPILVTDAAVLASKVDGVLLVIRPGQTREDVAQAMLEQMKRAGANIIGVALNRIPRRGSHFYGGYAYYSSYYTKSEYFNGKNGGGTKPARKALWGRPKPAREAPTKPVEKS